MSKMRKATMLAAACGYTVKLLQDQRSDMLLASVPTLHKKPENALVLGSGGLLGLAWMTSSLIHLQEQGLWVQKDDDLRIGTSAGSMLASLLGNGFSAEYIIKVLSTGKHPTSKGDITLPSSPKRENVPFKPSDFGFLKRTLASGRAPHLGTVVTSLFPEGLEETEQIEAFIDNITGGFWPSTPTWIVAAEISAGLRTIFTKHSGASMGRAVAASCAVPALFRPVTVGTKRYVDGGTISCHNLDLAIQSGAKQITAITPISGYTKIDPRAGANQALNQFVRNSEQFSINRIRRQLEKGTRLRLISPGSAARAILSNGSLMDSSRMADLIKISLNEPPQIRESW